MSEHSSEDYQEFIDAGLLKERSGGGYDFTPLGERFGALFIALVKNIDPDDPT